MAKKVESTATGTGPAAEPTKKPRKAKSPARWAVFQESGEGFIKAVDNQPTEKAAKEEAAKNGLTGTLHFVCIHATATAKPVTEVQFTFVK